jgi:hypothetical protein
VFQNVPIILGRFGGFVSLHDDTELSIAQAEMRERWASRPEVIRAAKVRITLSRNRKRTSRAESLRQNAFHAERLRRMSEYSLPSGATSVTSDFAPQTDSLKAALKFAATRYELSSTVRELTYLIVSGIYLLAGPDDFYYIGESVNIPQRFQSHTESLENNNLRVAVLMEMQRSCASDGSPVYGRACRGRRGYVLIRN